MNLPGDDPSLHGRDRVAAILAITVGTSILVFTIAVLWDALFHGAQAGLSENATQVLTGAFSGIIGALAVYLGARLARGPDEPPPPPPPPPPPHA